MSLESRQSEPKNRNWYKVATLALSAAMLILTFMSVVYYRRVDRDSEGTDLLERKIEQLQSRLAEVRQIPKIGVRSITVKTSGLPERSFASLPVIPAVIQVQHLEGGTAKGISVLAVSESRIVDAKSTGQIEKVEIQRMADNQTLLIEVPSLRRGSKVEVELMQEELGNIELETRLETGEVVSRRDASVRNLPDFIDDFSVSAEPSLVTRIDPAEFDTTFELEAVIKSLQKSQQLRGREYAYSRLGSMFISIAIVVPSLLVMWFISVTLVNSITFFVRRPVVKALESGRVFQGMEKKEVAYLSNKWDMHVYSMERSDVGDEIWFYDEVKKPLIGGTYPGVLLIFNEEKLVDYWILKSRPQVDVRLSALRDERKSVQ